MRIDFARQSGAGFGGALMALIFAIVIFSGIVPDAQAKPIEGENIKPTIEFFVINKFLSDIGGLSAIADFPQQSSVGTTVTLDGTKSTSLTGTITEYKWDIYYEDPETGARELVETKTGEKVDFTADRTGFYPIVLTVTNDQGETAQSDNQITIGEGNVSSPATSGVRYVTDIAVMFEFRACDPDNAHLNGTLTITDGSEPHILEQIPCARWRVPHIFESPGTYKAILALGDEAAGNATSGQAVAEIGNIKVEQLTVNPEKPSLSCSVRPSSFPIIAGETSLVVTAKADGLRYGKIDKFVWSEPAGADCEEQGDTAHSLVCANVQEPGEAQFSVSVEGNLLIDTTASCSIDLVEQLEIGELSCSPGSVQVESDGLTPNVTCTVGGVPDGARVSWSPSPGGTQQGGTTARQATYAFGGPARTQSISATVTKDGQSATARTTVEISDPAGTDPGGGNGGGGTGNEDELKAAFTVVPGNISAETLVQLDASVSTPAARISSYIWNFSCGDESQTLPQLGKQGTIVFSAVLPNAQWPALCTIALDVFGSDGSQDRAEKQITIVQSENFAEVQLIRVPQPGISGYIMQFSASGGTFLGAQGKEILGGWAGVVEQTSDQPNIITVSAADLDKVAEPGDRIAQQIVRLSVSSPDTVVTLVGSQSCFEKENPQLDEVGCTPELVGTQSDKTLRFTNEVAINTVTQTAARFPNPFDSSLALTSDFAADRPTTALYLFGGLGALGLAAASFYLFRKV